MAKIVSFGEVMLRLSSPLHQRFVQAGSFEANYGGAECNVSAALAGFGMDSYFVTCLPEHEVGEAALQAMRRYGVDTRYVVRGGDRLGIYYLETGVGLRPSKVIYDRANSSFCQLQPGVIDWEEVMCGADWFHWTGITPALGKLPAEELKLACQAAQKAGAKISTDLNYRSKLWTEAEAQAVMPDLMPFVDICIANEEHAKQCLNFEMKDKPDTNDQFVYNSALVKALKKEFGFSGVAVSQRSGTSATLNNFSVLYHDDQDCKTPQNSKEYSIEIVDRVGGGDAFVAGLIYGLLTKTNTKEALEFGVATAALKHTVHGDFYVGSVQEVENLIISGGGGRVDR